MNEMTASTLLFVIATALISLAFTTDTPMPDELELFELQDTVATADHMARFDARHAEPWPR